MTAKDAAGEATANGATLLGRDAILAASKGAIKYEVVHVPEMGGDIRVRGMTSNERDDFETSCIQGSGKNSRFSTKAIRAKLCVRSIVDADGKRLFQDSEYVQFGMLPASLVEPIYEVAARLSHLSATDVEDLAKNSPSAPTDDA